MMKIYIATFAILMTSSSLAKHLVGYSNENQKIAGGEDAEQGQFPYQVSIEVYAKSGYRSNYCGGTIYSETVIVTAAHCCYLMIDATFFQYEVIAGDLIRSDNSGLEQRSKIKDILIHPDYYHGKEYDICLLYLETELDFSGNDVKYIEAAIDDPEPGTMCDISGWGENGSDMDESADHLQWANVTIGSNQLCQEQYPSLEQEIITCAGGYGKSTCTGDRGGPLVCDEFLVGVASFLSCNTNTPGVYTSVSAFYEWIRDNANAQTTPSTTSTTTTTPTTTTTTTPTTMPTTTSTTTPTTTATTPTSTTTATTPTSTTTMTSTTTTTPPPTTITTMPITTATTTTATSTSTTSGNTTSMSSIQLECSFLCISFAIMMLILGIFN